MATYEDIRAYFEDSGRFKEVVSTAAANPIVTGFTLDVNPFWSFLYDLENGLIDSQPWNWDAFWENVRLWRSGWWRSVGSGPFFPFPMSRNVGFQGFRRRNLSAKVAVWEEAMAGLGINGPISPLILTVVHRPLRSHEGEKNDSPDDQTQLQTLIRGLNERGADIRFEERPVARFAGATAIAGKGNSTGTIGGILRDKSGNCYGITCDHVATKGDIVSDSAGTQIGKCIASTKRVLLTKPNACDPATLRVPQPFPSNGPDLNVLDCSIIALQKGSTASNIAGLATLSSGQDVVLDGAKTNQTRHKLGSLAIGYTFRDGSSDFCFRDSIELLPQPRGPFGGTLGSWLTTMPTQGDSGGWVLTNDQPPRWAGMFYGEDGFRGFLIRAQWVFDWAENEVGHGLTF
jgi:hypothetical protein